MPWPLSLLTHAASWIALLFTKIIGHTLLAGLQALLQHVVIPLLQATLFHPFTLTGSGFVATVMGEVWQFMVLASGGVALLALLWGIFRRVSGAAMGSRLAWSEIAEGFGMYALVLVGGYAFLAALLSMANTVTVSLLGATQGYLSALANPTFGTAATTLAGAILVYLFYPIVGFMLAAVLLWAVIQWLMRQVDLVFYGGLLPVTAALSMSGNKSAFTWAWQETMGALFSQLSMAVAWWVAWVFLSAGAGTSSTVAVSVPGSLSARLLALRAANGGTLPVPHVVTFFGSSFSLLHLGVGIVAFTLVGRAPQMLQNITGHQHAGVAGLAMGMAAGGLLARTGRSLAGATPAGAAITQAVRARQAGAEATAARWGAGKTVGQGLRAAGGWMANSKPGQAVRSAGAAAFSRGQAAVSRAVNSLPTGLAQNVHGTGRLVASSARGVGSAATWAARSRGGRAARSAASLAYQPRRTLGAMLTTSYGTAGAATFVTTGAKSAAITSTIDADEARRQTHLDVDAYTKLTGTTGSADPVEFPKGAWQGNVFEQNRRNAPAFLPRADRRYQ